MLTDVVSLSLSPVVCIAQWAMMLDLAKIVRTYELNINEALYTSQIILFKQVYVR
jgi:hypothetical protein